MITLVMGKRDSGKTYLLDLLPKRVRFSVWGITMAGLRRMKKSDPYWLKGKPSIVLATDAVISTYQRKQLVKVAKKLSDEGKYVYIHCRPEDYRWLKEVFE